MFSRQRHIPPHSINALEEQLRRLMPHEAVSPRHREQLEQRILRARAAHMRNARGRASWKRALGAARQLGRAPVAAGVLLAAGLTLALLLGRGALDGADTAWALEQSIAALEGVRTVYMSGTQPNGETFECWIRPKGRGDELDCLRFASPDVVAVARGDTVQAYFPRSATGEILGGMFEHAVHAWYLALQLRPWVGDTLLAQLQAQATDWQQSYGRDEQGRNCAFVQCGFPPLGISFWFAFDTETKRVVSARQWMNLGCEGKPAFEVTVVTYDEEIPEERFELQTPAGTRVFDGRILAAQQLLLKKAELLYQLHKYREAIEVYLEIYEQYPNWNYASHALMMVGICYDWLGDQDQRLKYLEQAAHEYPDLRGWSEATWFYLAGAYSARRDWERALAALHKCVELCPGVRDPQGFPWKDAREMIRWVEQQMMMDEVESLGHEHRYAEAIEAYLKAHEHYPDSCDAAYCLVKVAMC